MGGTDVGMLEAGHVGRYPVGRQGHRRVTVIIGKGAGRESDANYSARTPVACADGMWSYRTVPCGALADGAGCQADTADKTATSERRLYITGSIAVRYLDACALCRVIGGKSDQPAVLLVVFGGVADIACRIAVTHSEITTDVADKSAAIGVS